MSWSITLIGTSENVAQALEANSEKLTGQSKIEYDAALPHLTGLVRQNFNEAGTQIVKIEASGHGYTNFGTCSVSLTNLGSGVLV